ncbi:MAG: hypothetical protein AAF488_07595, partial [Planctomycetota bacterium]
MTVRTGVVNVVMNLSHGPFENIARLATLAILVLGVGSVLSPFHNASIGPEELAPAAKPAPSIPAPKSNNWSRSERYALREGRKGNKEGGAGAAKNVKMALDWLVRHQKDDGSWSSNAPLDQCRNPESPCENEDPWHKSLGTGFTGFDVGVTGLALLAFTGRGSTHVEAEKSAYRESIEKALSWLLAQQSQAKE